MLVVVFMSYLPASDNNCLIILRHCFLSSARCTRAPNVISVIDFTLATIDAASLSFYFFFYF